MKLNKGKLKIVKGIRYMLRTACPKCQDNRGFNRIRLRDGLEECRVCGHIFLKTERLELKYKKEVDENGEA